MGKRLTRMGSKVTGALAGLGVVLSGIGLYEPGSWRPYAALMCVSVTLVSLWIYPYLRAWWSRMARARQPDFLTRRIADQMIAIAIQPRRFPPCEGKEMRHAIGVAALGMAATDVQTRLRHLCFRLNVRMGEIAIEKFANEDVLIEHVVPLRRIWAHAYGLRHGLATECVRLVPDGDLVYEELRSLETILEEDVIQGLDDLLRTLPSPGESAMTLRDWRRTLDTRLRKEILPRLNEACSKVDRLPAALEAAQSIVDRTKQEWQWDIDEVWGDDLCRPRDGGDTPDRPARVSEFIRLGARDG